MASYNKCPTGWRVRVRKQGQVHTATFPTKQEAQTWAIQRESGILSGKYGQIPKIPFSRLIERYIKEVIPSHAGGRPEEYRLKRTVTSELGSVILTDLSPEHFALWRDKRLQSVSNTSVLREWATLAAVCNIAVREWRWLSENPMRGVRRPKANPPRQRLITPDEIEAILIACGSNYENKQARVGLAFEFAIETGMRAGELCKFWWGCVHEKHVHLPKEITKTRMPRDVPLSPRAIALLDQIKGVTGDNQDACCFGLTSPILDALFRKAKERAGVGGFTFHDSRALALTRLSRRLNVMQLARMSGHQDVRTLQRVYYRESIEDIASLL
jgi:integrase